MGGKRGKRPRKEAKVGSTEYGTEHAVSVDWQELIGWLINC